MLTFALYESVSGSNVGLSVATSPLNDSAESVGDAPTSATRHATKMPTSRAELA